MSFIHTECQCLLIIESAIYEQPFSRVTQWSYIAFIILKVVHIPIVMANGEPSETPGRQHGRDHVSEHVNHSDNVTREPRQVASRHQVNTRSSFVDAQLFINIPYVFTFPFNII